MFLEYASNSNVEDRLEGERLKARWQGQFQGEEKERVCTRHLCKEAWELT